MKYEDRMAKAKERMNICTECEHFIKTTKFCDECGCYLPIKVRIPILNCPIDKW